MALTIKVGRTKKKEAVPMCPYCKTSEYTVGHGFNVTVEGKKRRFKCQKCGHTFYNSKGKEE